MITKHIKTGFLFFSSILWAKISVKINAVKKLGI